MYCFEPPRGQTTLASEIASEVELGTIQLFICDTVARELHEVIRRDYPSKLSALEAFLEAYGIVEIPQPDDDLRQQALAVCVDQDDAPILAVALQSAQIHDMHLLLSNDFETFHTDQVKALLKTVNMEPVSLYGLLRLLGLRP